MSVAGRCIDAQLVALEQTLVKNPDAAPARFSDSGNPAGFVIRVPGRPWADPVWQRVNASGLAEHLDPRLVTVLGTTYPLVEIERGFDRDAETTLASLNALSLMPPPDAARRFRTLGQIEQLRLTIANMDQIARQIRDGFAVVRLSSSRPELEAFLHDSGTLTFCRGHGFPIESLRTA